MFGTLVRLAELSQPFKRAQDGLFGGKTKLYGNNVPFSKHKTRRSWLPNVQRKRLASEALGENIRVKVTTRVLRTIKKHGGVDKYLTKTPPHKLSERGMELRMKVKDAMKANEIAFRESPEGKLAYQVQNANVPGWLWKHKALHAQARRTGQIIAKKPTLEEARQARKQLASELGLKKALPSAAQTWQYILERRKL